ncbi:MAG: acyl--CoA ligase, partial [Streptomycetaceae bacterium]|nr:acyl--CoA ligase [Streptomycetaceae bacterium]
MATSTSGPVPAPAPDPIAALTAPGSRFELAEEDVLGVRMRVLVNRPRSLAEFVRKSAHFGEREYVVHDDGTRWTYAAHARAVASVARALRERYGVGPGDRVAILAANRPEWLVTFWATVSLGAVAVGMNGWWAGDEIRYGLADCTPKVLVADRRRLERLPEPPVPVVEMETGFADLVGYAPDADLPTGPGDEDAPALILYTSGTTGRPKGAVLTHRNVIAMQNVQALLAARALAHVPEDRRPASPPPGRWLVNGPFFHVSGLLAGAVAALADGHTMVLYSGRFDVPSVLATI